MNIIDRIEILCKKKSTTITAVERELNFGRGSIKKWNSSSPSIDKIKKIADYFNVSTDFIIGRDEPKTDSVYDRMETKMKNKNFKAFFSMAETMSDEELDKTIKIIKTIRGDDD